MYYIVEKQKKVNQVLYLMTELEVSMIDIAREILENHPLSSCNSKGSTSALRNFIKALENDK
jgi:hypothetical protein